MFTTDTLANPTTSTADLRAALKSFHAYNGVSRFSVEDLRAYALKVADLRLNGVTTDLSADNVDAALGELRDAAVMRSIVEPQVAADVLAGDADLPNQEVAVDPVDETTISDALRSGDNDLVEDALRESFATSKVPALSPEQYAFVAALVVSVTKTSKVKASKKATAERAPRAPRAAGEGKVAGRVAKLVADAVRQDDGTLLVTTEQMVAAGCPDSWAKYPALWAPSSGPAIAAAALGWTTRLRKAGTGHALVLIAR